MNEVILENGYAICPNEWIEDLRITKRGLLPILLKISSLTAEKGYCYASNEYLAKYFNVYITTISKQIKKLEQLGYIKIEYIKQGALIISREIWLSLKAKTVVVKGNKRLSLKAKTVVVNDKENSISNNIISNNKRILSKDSTRKKPKEIKTDTNYGEAKSKEASRLIDKKEKKEKEILEKDLANDSNSAKAYVELINNKYGEFDLIDFTKITYEKYKILFKRWNEKDIANALAKMNDWMGSKGKRYKNHHYALRNWLKKEEEDGNIKHKLTMEEWHLKNIEELNNSGVY